MDSPTRPTVFISYSHKDESWKDRVVKQLRVLERHLEVWDDRQIDAGDDWQSKIEMAMANAQAAVLLISADFLNSRFISGIEVPELLVRRQNNGLRLIPVIVHPCPWTTIPWLSETQGRPKNGKPLDSFTKSKAEQHLSDLALEIRDLLGSNPGQEGEPTSRGRNGKLPLPVVVASLTAEEAEALFTGEAFKDYPAHKKRFDLLLEALGRSHEIGLPPSTDVKREVLSRYGERREDWRPFSSDPTTLHDFLEKMVDQLNYARRRQVQEAHPDVLLEFHSATLFAAHGKARVHTADYLRKGCLLVMDPLALFHPQFVLNLNSSSLIGSNGVTVICTGPLDLSSSGVAAAVKEQLAEHLPYLDSRFDLHEPQWVMRIDDPSSLRLWLKLQLPIAMSHRKGALPNEETLDHFSRIAKEEANITHQQVSSLFLGIKP